MDGLDDGLRTDDGAARALLIAFYVEPRSDARTPLEDFFSTLLMPNP